MRLALAVFITLAAIGFQQWMWLQVISAEAKQDYRDIIRNGSLNTLGRKWHNQSFVKIFLLGVGVCLPFLYHGWVTAVALLVLNGAEFALLFDRRLNRMRGLDGLYVGKNSGIDLFFRKFFAKAPGRALLFCKVSGIILAAGTLLWSLWGYFFR